jgi:hypothetical protein
VWVALAALSVSARPSAAQEIVLDRPVRAGNLIFYPTVRDANAYYYAPTRARLATGAGGRPQFSLLRYVENESGAGGEGEGGAILHAVVELGVSDAELDAARSELRRLRPGASVAGPVVFRSGKFGLVTTFTGDNQQTTTRVVGLGTAPLLDGGKAAVAIQLTKLGSTLLWESFHTATPDISFMFEMEMSGYREPKRAVIVADLDRVYEHQSFAAGIAGAYVQTEIATAFDDLREKKVIRLEQVGEDQQLEGLVQAAYSKLVDLMFQPATAQIAQEAAGAGRKSALDRASELLEKRREEVRKENKERRDEAARAQAAENAQAVELAKIAANAQAQQAKQPPGGTGQETAKSQATSGADDPWELFFSPEGIDEFAKRHGLAAGAPAAAAEAKQEPLPELAAVFAYEMKTSRQRGEYRVDLNKWTADSVSLRFDQNIGDLTRYLDDPQVFRNVNLDDPLYRQREVSLLLAGANASDFEDMLSFVTVELRKRHQSGEETFQEARIDRATFNSDAAGGIKLVYGWKGDEDMRRWRDFEYRTLWVLHGAEPIVEDWRPASFNAIPLRPPFQRQPIQLDAGSGEQLEAKGVRSVSVKLTSELNGHAQTQQVTLDTKRGDLSKRVELVVPRGSPAYRYQVQWLMGGNQAVSGPEQTTDQQILYVDEVPEA